MPVNTSSCAYCGTANASDATLCVQCGATLEIDIVLKAGTKLGAYTVERVLGRGGFGITYLMRDSSAAVKEFYPDGLVTRNSTGQVIPKPGHETEFRGLLERFAREARMLWKLEHPSATKYLGFWQENGTAYLAMEYLEGETLESRIARGQKLSEPEARRAMLEILDLLEVVHAQGVLHRDIKPANIVLTAQRAELIDFGSVTSFNRKGVTTRLLTPDYAPLEFYGSDVQLSPASDLYSLCATFYEAVTLTKPPSAIERMNGSSLTPVRQLEPIFDSQFAAALEKGLSVPVHERHASAKAFREVVASLWTPRVQNLPKSSQNTVGCAGPFIATTLAVLALGILTASINVLQGRTLESEKRALYAGKQCVSISGFSTPGFASNTFYILDDILQTKIEEWRTYEALAGKELGLKTIMCELVAPETIRVYVP
jgi:serine/threonine protein kinase